MNQYPMHHPHSAAAGSAEMAATPSLKIMIPGIGNTPI